MKKILFILIILLCKNVVLKAQTNVAKIDLKNSVYSASNLKNIADMLTDQFLKTKLGLNAKQETEVSALLQSFLAKRASKFEQADYPQQKVILFESFKTELSRTLSSSQLNQFMSLKPDEDDPSLLKIIFY